METKEMTVAQLQIEIAVLMGGKQEPHDINGITYLLWNVPGCAEVGIDPPHYADDISAAWPLIQAVRDAGEEARWRWSDYWVEDAPVLSSVADSAKAARYISCGYYYAVTGTRVTIKEQ